MTHVIIEQRVSIYLTHMLLFVIMALAVTGLGLFFGYMVDKPLSDSLELITLNKLRSTLNPMFYRSHFGKIGNAYWDGDDLAKAVVIRIASAHSDSAFHARNGRQGFLTQTINDAVLAGVASWGRNDDWNCGIIPFTNPIANAR